MSPQKPLRLVTTECQVGRICCGTRTVKFAISLSAKPPGFRRSPTPMYLPVLGRSVFDSWGTLYLFIRHVFSVRQFSSGCARLNHEAPPSVTVLSSLVDCRNDAGSDAVSIS